MRLIGSQACQSCFKVDRGGAGVNWVQAYVAPALSSEESSHRALKSPERFPAFVFRLDDLFEETLPL